MSDLLKERATFWHIRLKKCMDARGYNQSSFVKALNNKYGTRYQQKDVSRWMNIGAKIKNGEVGFPKYETMFLVANFFGVDIGYLTGETDEDSFTLEKACSYMGLNGEAINAIREITHPENKTGLIRKFMREVFNKFLSAEGFPKFFNSLFDLYMTSTSLNEMKQREFEDIDLDSAIDNMRGKEFSWKIERYELNEALILLINEIYPI